VRDIYPTAAPERFQARANDDMLCALARAVAGKLGGKVGIAPRIYLRKLVAGVLDRVDLFPDFDPMRDFELTLQPEELSAEEQAAVAGKTPDDIALDV
jgi:hypothetical protein